MKEAIHDMFALKRACNMITQQNMVLLWKISHVLYEKVYSTVALCLGCLGALIFNRFPVLPLPDQSVKRKQWLITE